MKTPLQIAPGQVIVTPWGYRAEVANVRDACGPYTVIELCGGLSFRIRNDKKIICPICI